MKGCSEIFNCRYHLEVANGRYQTTRVQGLARSLVLGPVFQVWPRIASQRSGSTSTWTGSQVGHTGFFDIILVHWYSSSARSSHHDHHRSEPGTPLLLPTTDRRSQHGDAVVVSGSGVRLGGWLESAHRIQQFRLGRAWMCVYHTR